MGDPQSLTELSVLSILYRDADYVAIDKPSHLLTHPSELAPREPSALKVLRDQIGARVYPVHRLDRQTSGVLLFALSSEAARAIMLRWPEGEVRKTYHAIARGWTSESGEIDRALRETPDKPRVPARTLYRRLRTAEFADPVGPYASARYSWVELEALTGRQHQIRKHLLSISHPIVGDTVYGDGEHNRYFRAKFGIHRLLLHARQLDCPHPTDGRRLSIEAPVPREFLQVFPIKDV